MTEIQCTLATVISVTVAICVGKIAYKKIVTQKLSCVFVLHYNFLLQILLQLQK